MSVTRSAAQAELFKTLGHPTRVRVLELLGDGELAVHELLERLDVEANNLSQQLGVLRRSSLVVCERRHGRVIYSLSSPLVGELLASSRAVLAELRTVEDDELPGG